MSGQPIVVKAPRGTGGRRVRIDGTFVGLAHNVRDLVEFLRRAGLEIDEDEAVVTSLIDWDGAGPDRWGEEAP